MRTSNFFRKQDVENINNIHEQQFQEKDKETDKLSIVHNSQEKTKTSSKISNRPNFKEFEVLDTNVIKYVIENFPDSASEIRESLTNLYNTLENTIDNIEDSSSTIIKLQRDFKLSEEYRSKSIKIYNIGQDIKKYIKWMTKIDENRNYNVEEKDDNQEDIVIKDEYEAISFEGGRKIFEDFTMVEPKAFKLFEHIVQVEDWDDLLVKTAEVLTKNYKENRLETSNINENVKIIRKKSQQNTFRDTVIDMLNEYNINLINYEIKN